MNTQICREILHVYYKGVFVVSEKQVSCSRGGLAEVDWQRLKESAVKIRDGKISGWRV